MPISEANALKFEVCVLRQQILVRDHADVVKEQQAVIEAMRLEASASATAKYNPQTRAFVEPPQAVQPRKPKIQTSA